MLFDPRLALAEIEKQAVTPATSATSATQERETALKVAKVAEVAALPRQIRKTNDKAPDDHRHGFALGGRPKIWTGKVVSLDEWRRLSEWEKHGPNGRHWNGITRQWELPE
ncbi:hypothetical protein [Sulfitobacter sp. SK011]|uniref:hypothetical protein n=1 Tax=Sulfitobacter sp. SK011 TaxID=1389004 RepID=UPI000E0BA968|nr:hypothetical protein [Sulfitobacter sp. SK011]AXI43530.1 hypothetical protein C1J02_17565 [Sulfitobacter sp. SK011]